MRHTKFGKHLLTVAALGAITVAGFAAAGVLAASAPTSLPAGVQRMLCSSGFVDAVIGGQPKCLHAGEFCSAQYESDYERYGFACVSGRLQSGSSSSPPPPTTSAAAPTSTTTNAATTTAATTTAAPTPTTAATTAATPTPATVATTTSARPTTTPKKPSPPASGGIGTGDAGASVLLAPRTKTSGCVLGALPDRRCSPGAYSTGLTRSVICSAGFHTSSLRNVPESVKHQVEIEYGLAPTSYGSTLEIDHIVSLELGGSNDIANLFPEMASPPGGGPGYRTKDKLENKLHDLVCAGAMTLRAVQGAISSDWKKLYRSVFGIAPIPGG